MPRFLLCLLAHSLSAATDLLALFANVCQDLGPDGGERHVLGVGLLDLLSDVEGGMFDFRAIATQYDPQLLVDVFGNIPAPLIDASFLLRKPVEYTVGTPQ